MPDFFCIDHNFILGFWRFLYLFVHSYFKNQRMKKLDYDDFFYYIWEDEYLNDIISMRFLDDEQEFIRNMTMELYRHYDFGDMSPKHIKKTIEIIFVNLAMFEPKIHNIKPVSDRGRNDY